jgi:uncharacterized cupredoxin-like copper-binding protein
VLPSAGPLVIVVSGGCVSTVQLRVAGVGSTFPTPSMARTSKVCAPSVSPVIVYGLLQLTNDPVFSRHWNVEPVSVELKVNVTLVALMTPVGPLRIDVSGGVASTVQLRVAGVGSTFPTASMARTLKVYTPVVSPVRL